MLFPKKKTLPAEYMNSVANTPVQIGLREFQELCHVYHGWDLLIDGNDLTRAILLNFNFKTLAKNSDI